MSSDLLDIPVVLYTRQQVRYPGAGAHIKSFFKDPTDLPFSDPFSCPIHTILNILKTVGAIKFETKIRYARSGHDSTFGEYPFMLVGYNFITRDQILPFLQEIYRLGPGEDRNEAAFVEHQCVNRMHKAVMYYKYVGKDGEVKGKGFFGRMMASTRSFLGFKQKEAKKRFFGKVLGVASETEAHSILTETMDFLATKYANKRYLFSQAIDNKVVLTSLSDLVVYAYLKEVLTYAPSSPAITLLLAAEKYAPLKAFISNVEADLGSGQLKFLQSPMEAKEIYAAGEKYVHRTMIDYPLGSRTVPKLSPPELSLSSHVFKYVVLAGIFAGLTMLNIASEPYTPEPSGNIEPNNAQ